jgi:hypothetical protein
MAFQISEFTSALQQDGARPNLFQVVMPGLPGNVGSSANAPFSFLCKAAQLPGSTIGTVPMYYFGREAKFAGNRTFADWTITVINDENFSVRNSIEQWMNSINSNAGNVRLPSPVVGGGSGGQPYAIDAVVNQYGKSATAGVNGVIKSYNFVGLFPVDLSPIDLDWGTNDSIEEFTVTFSYQYWTSVGTTS